MVLVSILLSMTYYEIGFCLEDNDIVRLKKAGISNPVIELILDEKIIETCALTIDEIVNLKQSGLNSDTISIIIKRLSFVKNSSPMVYGKNLHGIKSVTIKDLIELKRAGFSDAVIQNVILINTEEISDNEREKVLNMLENMEMTINLRKSGGGGIK